MTSMRLPGRRPPETEFAAQDQSPFVTREFVCTGWDDLGEPTHNTSLSGAGVAWAADQLTLPRSSYFGIIDLAGFKKDRFYLLPGPMAARPPHGAHPPALELARAVSENCPGPCVHFRPLGRALPQREITRKQEEGADSNTGSAGMTFDTSPGELKVVACKAGKPWAEDVVKTTGIASRVALGAGS